MLAEATSTIEEQLADPEFFADPYRSVCSFAPKTGLLVRSLGNLVDYAP